MEAYCSPYNLLLLVALKIILLLNRVPDLRGGVTMGLKFSGDPSLDGTKIKSFFFIKLVFGLHVILGQKLIKIQAKIFLMFSFGINLNIFILPNIAQMYRLPVVDNGDPRSGPLAPPKSDPDCIYTTKIVQIFFIFSCDNTKRFYA